MYDYCLCFIEKILSKIKTQLIKSRKRIFIGGGRVFIISVEFVHLMEV
jgi:hypothetical protein